MTLFFLVYAALFVFTLCMQWIGIRDVQMRAAVNISTLALTLVGGALGTLLYRRGRSDAKRESQSCADSVSESEGRGLPEGGAVEREGCEGQALCASAAESRATRAGDAATGSAGRTAGEDVSKTCLDGEDASKTCLDGADGQSLAAQRTKEDEEQEWIIDKAAYLSFAHEKELTRRETEIAYLAVNGYSNQRLAEELYISEATVKKHLTHIYEKTGANGRKALREAVKNLQ